MEISADTASLLGGLADAAAGSDASYSDEFSDAKIVVGSRTFNVHRVIVSRLSSFLAAAFKRKWKEGSGTVVLDLPEGLRPYFPLVLRFLYGAKLALSAANCVPLLVLADRLMISSLHAAAMQYIALRVHQSSTDLCLILAAACEQEDSAVDVVVDVCIAAATDERSGWSLLLAASDADLNLVPLELWALILERVASRTLRSIRLHSSAQLLRRIQEHLLSSSSPSSSSVPGSFSSSASSGAISASSEVVSPFSAPSDFLSPSSFLPSEALALLRSSSSSSGSGGGLSAYRRALLEGRAGAGAAVVSSAVARQLLSSSSSSSESGCSRLVVDTSNPSSRFALHALLRTAGTQHHHHRGVGSNNNNSQEPIWFGAAAVATADRLAAAAEGGENEKEGETGSSGVGGASAAEMQRQAREEEAKILQRRRDLSLMMLRLLRSFLSVSSAAAAASHLSRSLPPPSPPLLLMPSLSDRSLFFLHTMSPLLDLAASNPILNGTAAWSLARTMMGAVVTEALQKTFGAGGAGGSGNSNDDGDGESDHLAASIRTNILPPQSSSSGLSWITEGRAISWLEKDLARIPALPAIVVRLASVAAASFGSLALRSHARQVILASADISGSGGAIAAEAARRRRRQRRKQQRAQQRRARQAVPTEAVPVPAQQDATVTEAVVPASPAAAAVAPFRAEDVIAPVLPHQQRLEDQQAMRGLLDGPADDNTGSDGDEDDHTDDEDDTDVDEEARRRDNSEAIVNAAGGGSHIRGTTSALGTVGHIATPRAASTAHHVARRRDEEASDADEENDDDEGLDFLLGLEGAPVAGVTAKRPVISPSLLALRGLSLPQVLADFSLSFLSSDELRVHHEDDIAAFVLDLICELWLSPTSLADFSSPSSAAGAPPRRRHHHQAKEVPGINLPTQAKQPSKRWLDVCETRAKQVTRALWSSVRWEFVSDSALFAAVAAVLGLRQERQRRLRGKTSSQPSPTVAGDAQPVATAAAVVAASSSLASSSLAAAAASPRFGPAAVGDAPRAPQIALTAAADESTPPAAGAVSGVGSASRPFVATSGDEIVLHHRHPAASSSVVSSLPVPQGRLLLLTDDRVVAGGAHAPGSSLVVNNAANATTATRRSSGTSAIAATAAAGGALAHPLPPVIPGAAAGGTGVSVSGSLAPEDEEEDEETVTNLLGLSDADISNARYRHRLAGMVATPAAAVAIGLLPPRLSYASSMRNRPLLAAAPPVSPSAASGSASAPSLAGTAAFSTSTSLIAHPLRQHQHQYRHGGFSSASSLRRLQQQGPLALLTDGEDGTAGSSGGASAPAGPSGGGGTNGGSGSRPFSEDGSINNNRRSEGRSVVFGRHAVSFASWPPSSSAAGTGAGSRPLLTNAPANQETGEGNAGGGGGSTTRLLRLRARATGDSTTATGIAGTATATGTADSTPAVAHTPLILPNLPLEEMTEQELAELLAFSLQQTTSAAAGGEDKE